MPSQITHGELFAGIGGFALGAELVGIKTLWSVEIDKFCNRVLDLRFPETRRYTDIREVSGYELAPVDVISAGSPCQDLSIAGRRPGLEGERSGLFMEFIRILKEMRNATNGAFPRFAVWENATGALSLNKGWDFDAVLTAFHDAACVELAYRVTNAEKHGVPQRRRRIILVTR